MPTLKLRNGFLAPAESFAETEITLEAFREGVRPEAGRFALVLPNDAGLEEVAATLDRFAAVVLQFPAFKDGRAYSQARLLRERYGYRGEIRARGDVLRDQILFMARAGFDGFEVGEEQAEAFTEALSEFAYFYQPAADAALPVWRRRAARAEAA
ncbi:MAG: DUF934 domain-containing protein [Pseudomonadota bacterium]|nr:DUF934 domain-containing protein [Pseudomonadota bacterium]